MIVDMAADAHAARRCHVLDVETGERLDDRLRIFYADDEAGLIRHYPDDEVARAHFPDAPPLDVVWAELHRPIRIVPRSPEEVAEIDEADRLYEASRTRG